MKSLIAYGNIVNNYVNYGYSRKMTYIPGGGGSGNIATSGDVALSNPAEGQVLAYNAAIAKWVNASATGVLTVSKDGNQLSSHSEINLLTGDNIDIIVSNNILNNRTDVSISAAGLVHSEHPGFFGADPITVRPVVSGSWSDGTMGESLLNALESIGLVRRGATSADTIAPASVVNFRITSTTASSAALAWDVTTDNVAVAGYVVDVNGVDSQTISGNTTTITGLTSVTSYTFGIKAFDAAGNYSTRVTTNGTTQSTATAPVASGEGLYMTLAEAKSLPTSGTGFNNAKGIADRLRGGTVAPNLDDVNTRAGAIALTGAVYWLAGDKTDNALLNGLRTFILAAPGTNQSTTQALNPMRAIGGLLAAVDILNKAGAWNMNATCPNYGGQTFSAWLTGLETRNLGSGNSRWQSINFTSTDAANNWGAVARYAQIGVAIARNDTALLSQSVALFERYLGDTTKVAAFNKSSGYIASWDNTGSAPGKVNTGLGLVSSTQPGLDGVVVDDVNRGGTGYSAAAAFYGATSSGLTYPLEAAEFVWAEAAILHHLGYDVKNWSSKGLIRMGDWFHRAKDSSTGRTAYTETETKYGIYKNHRWLGNHFKGSNAYGTPVATASGDSGLLRAQPYADWVCGGGSIWLK